MKGLYIILFMLIPSSVCAVTCTEPISQGTTSTCDAITKGNITWTLNADYEVGQFITGDFFVVAPSGLSITAISAGGGEILGGTMKNIIPNISNQGLVDNTGCSTCYEYSAVNNVGTSFPVLLVSNDMIVTATEYGYYGAINPGQNNERNYTWVNEAAVLTVVSSPPASGSFRPGITDPDRTIYNISSINWSTLQNITPVAGEPLNASLVDMVARPWVDFSNDFQGRQIHPNNNMRDYGQELQIDISTAALYVNCNHTQAEKEPVLYGLLQYGIDAWATVKQLSSMWTISIAHDQGRKLPIMIAGEVLGISEIQAIWPKANRPYLISGAYGTYPADAFLFEEDEEFGYVTQGDVDNSTGVDCYYSAHQQYTTAMIGMPEWWHYGYNYALQCRSANFGSDSGINGDPYRGSNTASGMWGIALVAYLMDFYGNEWDNQAMYDYLDRYEYILTNAGSQPDNFGYTVNIGILDEFYLSVTNGGWIRDMWVEYRGNYPTQNHSTGSMPLIH